MTIELTVDELLLSRDRDLSSSGWMTITQERVDAFAHATGYDRCGRAAGERRAVAGQGQTVVPGCLMLSLLPVLLRDLYRVTDGAWGLNYGAEQVRFLAPVRVGAEIRLRASIIEATDRADGGVRSRIAVRVELRGSERPAMVGELLLVRYRVRDRSGLAQ